MAYDHYTDTNGVTWQILPVNNGFTLMATVRDDAEVVYDPPATDQMVKMDAGGMQIPTPFGDIAISPKDASPTGEQQRVLFTEIRDKIEAYAKANQGHQLMTVRAHPDVKSDNNWAIVLLVLVGLAVLSES